MPILAQLPPYKVFFALAMAVYACFGSPTPDQFGYAEIILLILLILSLRPNFLSFQASGILLACYGLSIPVLVSLTHGYAVAEVLRDVVPFLFLLMPVLYTFNRPEDGKLLAAGITFIGLIFSIRSLMSFGAVLFNPQDWLGTPPDLLYLANSPEVLFSAVMLLGTALFSRAGMRIRILFFAMSALPILAMTSMMQRASLLYLSVTAFLSFLFLLWHRPKRAFLLLGLFAVPAIFFHSFFEDVYRQLSFKSHLVGLNARGAEWAKVTEETTRFPESLFFGLGWGFLFENPAVGGLRVSFTHSLISSLFLKTGIIGLTFFGWYFFSLLKLSWRSLNNEFVYIAAIMGPLIIGTGLYASYKSFGFGLILMILGSFANKREILNNLNSSENLCHKNA